MNPLIFFRSKDVQRAIRRAARITGCPISLHTVRDGAESPRILSTGGCAACALVAGTRSGREACGGSRVPHAVRALRRKTPVPFVCHMGFACVSVAPLAAEGQPYVVTIGPYCASLDHSIAAAGRAMAATERSAGAGLVKLKTTHDDVADLLGDVATVSADVVPGVAEWLADTLRALWDAGQPVAEPEAASPEPSRRDAGGRANRPESDSYGAAAIAAAVLGGDRSGARRLIAVAMGEARGAAPAHGQSRLMGVAGASMEAMIRAGATLGLSWTTWATRLSEMVSTTDAKVWPGALARLLSTAAVPMAAARGDLIERVEALLAGDIADAPSLNEVAAALGCTPSAVTHALQRKFGMSFTQYLGRLRVAAAKDLLRRTKLSPAEVGRRVGIADTSNFARLFKKFEGITPTDYRARFGVQR